MSHPKIDNATVAILAEASRNRYLTKLGDRYRLYRLSDQPNDGLDKTGPYCPCADDVPTEYRHLIQWYRRDYLGL